MARITGLVKRGGVYQVRVRVPTDIVAQLKKREIVRSLRTSDRKEAESRVLEARIEIQNQFKATRGGQSSILAKRTAKDLSAEEIQSLTLRWFYDLEVSALAGGLPADRNEYITTLREDMATMHAELLGFNDPKDPEWAEPSLNEILSSNGVDKTENAESHDRLRRLILRGLIEARRRMHERVGGGEAGKPDSYFSGIDADAPPPQTKVVKGTTLRELLDQFLKEKGPTTLRIKTVGIYRAVISQFEEIVGPDTPITEIARHHCVAYRDLLKQMPANASKRLRGMKMQQVAIAARERNWPLLNPRTVNKSLETLSALFTYAVEECELMTKNPAKKIRLLVDGEKINRTFDQDQLGKLFANELFKDYALSDDPKVKHSRYWVPLIGLFSGMRQNEICQLYLEDIKAKEGIPYFAVREKLDDGKIAKDKHLKTKNARRDVPIHPALLRLGLLELVQIKKRAGAKRLFGELPYSKVAQNYSDAFQKWFSRFLKQSDVCAKRKVTFHGFRHTFRDELRRVDVSPYHSQALGGWEETKSLSEHYGQGYPLDILLREISKASYPGFPL